LNDDRRSRRVGARLARLTFPIVFVEVKKNHATQRDRFSTMPTCQTCIAEVAEVTDNAHQLRASTQQIKTLKNIFSGILIALFFYRRK
jgi:hypothetical protein